MARTVSASKSDLTRQFAIDVAKLVGHNCKDVVVLDVRGISPITDYFVIGTGTSARQMRSLCNEAEELGDARDFKALARSGYDGEAWLLTDFFDVVLHLFSSESRSYYDLDGLWGDAPKVPWEAPV